jgi:hypothetical protein
MSYYITNPGSDSAEKIEALFKEYQKCRVQRHKFAKELGATDYLVSHHFTERGISGFRFASKKGIYCINDELKAKEDGKVPKGLRFDRKLGAWVLALKTAEGKLLQSKLRALPKVIPGKARLLLSTTDNPDLNIGEIKRIVKKCPVKSLRGGFTFITGLFSKGEVPKDCRPIKKSRYYYLLGE